MKEIWTAKDLLAMAKASAGDYQLMADICLEGCDWEPVDFSGNLDGQNHSIYGLHTQTGLFDTLSGTVKNLHLRDAFVTAAGTYAGLLAGVITGTAEGCSVSGTLQGTGCLGAAAGKVSGSFLGGTALSVVTGPDGKYQEAGLCADVMMDKGALVGEMTPDAKVSGLWRDNTHRFEKLSQVMQARRERVVSYMRTMGTVQWRVSQDKLEYLRNDLGKRALQYQVFEKGKTYMGLPYCHSSGSLARFLSRMATREGEIYTTGPGLENGRHYAAKYVQEHPHLGFQEKDTFGFIQYMGNDCSGAVSWAWRQVSSVDIAEGGCYGCYSGDMVPTEKNKNEYGILPAGDFFASVPDLSIVRQQMGAEPFYESFAKSLRGDGLCGVDSNGHVLLISYDPVVIRDEAGKIQPQKSFFVTIEQGGGFFDSKDDDNQFKPDLPEPIQSSWRVDYRYYFFDMAHKGVYEAVSERRAFSGCDHCYLPITMEALQVENTPAVTPRVWLEGTTVHSNFCISATQCGGDPVYTQVHHDWHIFRQHPATSVDLAKIHHLPAGEFAVKVYLSNEQVVELAVSVQ